MEKDLQTKLEIYKILYMAYADEIRNLWQRSIFLAAFMTLTWGGYGALQLKAVEKIIETYTQSQNAEQTLNLVYVFSSLGLCLIIIVLSLLWIAMAKGSKFVQEAHEAHILKHNELDYLFCDLDKYQNGDYDTKTLKKTDKNSFWNPLKSYRYSPSKINIALGWVSLIISTILIYIHLFIQTSLKETMQKWLNNIQWVNCLKEILLNNYCLLVYPLIFVTVVGLVIHFTLKSKKISWCKQIWLKIKQICKNFRK